jgi:hypothetical protein
MLRVDERDNLIKGVVLVAVNCQQRGYDRPGYGSAAFHGQIIRDGKLI